MATGTIPGPYRLKRQTIRSYYLFALVASALAVPTESPAQVPNAATSAACASVGPDLADSPDHAKQLVDCGYDRSGEAEYVSATRMFDRAIDMARRIKDRKSLAAALTGSGSVLFATGKAAQAEPVLAEAASVAQAAGDLDEMAEAASTMGRLRTMQGRYEDARLLHQRSYELWNQAGDERGRAVGLNNVGNSYRALGDYRSALAAFQQSFEVLTKAGDRRRSATVIDNMGVVARRLGDYEQGRALALQALSIRESLNDRAGVAKSLDSLSEVYQAEGNYRAALDALGRSLDQRTALGAPHAIAESLNNIAVVYEAQGNYEQAISYLRRSLALNEKDVGSRSLVVEIHTHLGEVFLRQGSPFKAIESLEKSVALAEAGDYKVQGADARYALGRAYLAAGRITAARSMLESCLAMRDAAGDRTGRANVLIELADIDRRARRVDAAMLKVSEASTVAAALEMPEIEWRALTLIGRLEAARGRLQPAQAALDRAIAIIEDMRRQNPGAEEARSRFFAERSAPYQQRISLAVAADDIQGALAIAERSKARALLDALGGAAGRVTNLTADEALRDTSLRTVLTSANIEVGVAARATVVDDAHLSAARAKRAAARLAYEEFQARMIAAHPQPHGASSDVPMVSAADARGLIGPRAAIVEFVVGAERTFAFVITSSDVRVVTLPLTSALLNDRVQQFRSRLANRDLRVDESSRALDDLLVAPLRPSLRGTSDLILVPDGVLWQLPFQALRSADGRYLIEDLAISYAPSIAVLREMVSGRRAPAARTLLAFAGPGGAGQDPLPEMEKEVRQLAAIYGPSSRVYSGSAAREDRLKSEASKFGVLHVSAHGTLDDASPMYSHLALADPVGASGDDGMLEAWELMRLHLDAELVVFSACDTGRGRVAPGEGLLGLMWATFVGGAPAALVSQWRVDSASSTTLMIAFHRAWNRPAGMSRAAALRDAALSVLGTPGYSHPFYWAGFILAGDGS